MTVLALSALLPTMVGHMIVMRKLAGPSLVPTSLNLHPTSLQLWVLWVIGEDPEEGIKLGRNSRKVTQKTMNSLPLPMFQSKKPNLNRPAVRIPIY
jgi:hypothetical protein